jgi:hypothetical protein
MNKLELLKLIANAPKTLKGYSELLDYARNAYKQMMGVFPEGIDNIAVKQAAKEAAENRSKVIKFPEGGKDKTDFFTTRPDPRVKQPEGAKMDIQRANENIAGGSGYAEGDTKYNADILGEELARMRGFIKEGQDSTDMDPREYSKLYDEAYSYLTQLRRLNRKPPGEGELSVTIGGETKNMTPEGIMNFLMGRGKGADTNIGKAPKTTKTKPAVDPELQKAEDQKQLFMDFENRTETEAEMLARMKRQNKESVERLKKKKEKDLGDKLKDLPDDIDPDAMADGGRIGFDKGGEAGFAGDSMEGDKFAMPQPDNRPMEVPPNLGFQPIMAMPQKGIPGSGGIKELRQFLQAVGAPELGMGYNFPVGQSGILSVGAAPSGNVSAQFKMPLSGGRFGFKDGSKPKDPSKRSFLKLMGGLAAIPFIGKYFKPAAKVVEKAAPVVQEGAKLGYENFMLLVDKIKRLGKSVDNLATQERQKVTTYKGKDGSEYELVEDLTTGDISVTKDRPGIAVANRGMDDAEAIDVIEDRSTFIYKKGEDVVDTKTGTSKRTPDEYDEVKQTSGDGEGFDGIDEIDDRAVNEVINELTDVAPVDDLTANQYMGTKNLRSKKAGGGLAYMLGE